MTKKATELIFVSRILRDGSGVQQVTVEQQKQLENAKYVDEEYELNPLSLSNKTFIASGFNSYVVKLKS